MNLMIIKVNKTSQIILNAQEDVIVSLHYLLWVCLDREAGYAVTNEELSRHEKETKRRYEERRRYAEAFKNRSEAEIAKELEDKHRVWRVDCLAVSCCCYADLFRGEQWRPWAVI